MNGSIVIVIVCMHVLCACVNVNVKTKILHENDISLVNRLTVRNQNTMINHIK